MKALMAIQADLKAPKSQYNSFGKYKYRNCEDILEAVKPLLKKHGAVLTLSDEIREVGSIPFVEATALITSGDESISVTAQAGIDPNRKGMDIAQSFGSSSSYARKYALNGLFCIDDTKDADTTNQHGAPEPPKKLITMSDAKYILNGAKSIADLNSRWKANGKKFEAELSLEEYEAIKQLGAARKAEFEMAVA